MHSQLVKYYSVITDEGHFGISCFVLYGEFVLQEVKNVAKWDS